MNIGVDDEILAHVDAIAKMNGIGNRSDVVRQAICRWYYSEVEPRLKRANGRATAGRPKSRVR
jgi:metal-responsive CopG/Arc/MetJ family transcriptional regulator